jgi:flavin-dependent dehydrogenase
MRGSISYDAVIVGAGPAGLLCGRLMVEKGYRVLVIEARPEIDDKVCGAYLCPAGVELLKAMDLLPAMESLFEPVHGMILSSPDGQLILLVRMPAGQVAIHTVFPWIGDALTDFWPAITFIRVVN